MGKLNKDQLLSLLDKLMRPEASGLSERGLEEVLHSFCAGCPDPLKARWLIVECLDPMTDDELVERALAMPIRRMIDVPFSELPEGHFLRKLYK